ncbi:MAG: DUF4998 domain-containing protein [Tannerella sp.]|nr:DUF4998 domain-containing protein [Tannerella sp.]
MKRIIYFLTICLLGAYATSCDDNNSLHQKYIDQGEILYTGKVDSVKVIPGKDRVKFSWLIDADPRITKVVLYWDGRKESKEFEVNRTQPGVFQMDVSFDIPEGIYNFQLVTFDIDNNHSLPVNKNVSVYGDKYIASLMSRTVTSSKVSAEGNLTINWGLVENEDVQYTTVYFTDYTNPTSPVNKSVQVENLDTKTVIPNVKAGDSFSVVTTFLPKNALDAVESLSIEYTILE